MPCLLCQQGSLVKTVRFNKPAYIGDPVNAIKIYNEKEVDELIFLDIGASKSGLAPDPELVRRIANECFMPLTYGGGVTSVSQMRQLFQIGVEKIAINAAALRRPELLAEAAACFGRSSIVAAIDVQRDWLGHYQVFDSARGKPDRRPLLEYVQEAVAQGAGELLLTAVHRDGTWKGYDLELIQHVSAAVSVPLIACGGAGQPEDFVRAVAAGASAVAAGSLFVYQKKDQGVLINFPRPEKLNKLLLGDP